MVYKFLDKKSASLTDKSVSGSGILNNNNNYNNNNKNNNNNDNNNKNNSNNNDEIRQFHNNNEIKKNLELAKELDKPIIRKLKKKKS